MLYADAAHCKRCDSRSILNVCPTQTLLLGIAIVTFNPPHALGSADSGQSMPVSLLGDEMKCAPKVGAF